jgi:PAS domain S-box-containing protein
MKKHHQVGILVGVLVLAGLFLISRQNYLLFHGIAEIFSIVVACGIFMVAWNARRNLDNDYLLFLGIAYLFVAAVDTIHTLAYTGMGVFPGFTTDLPTQLWIAARYGEGLSLLIAPWFIRRRLKVPWAFTVYILAFTLLMLSLFLWEVFPACFVEGMGLTPFKKTSEYVISVILLASMMILLKRREDFEPRVLRMLVASILITIGSELAFTFYVHAYGLSNLVGHFLKTLSFYLIYRAIIQTGLARPYEVLFRNLKKSEEAVRERARMNELLLDSLPYPAMLIERGRIVLAANRIARDQGARVGGYCWFDFGRSKNIPQEHRRSAPPGGTKCTFCLADEAFTRGKATNDPDVSAFGQLWDTWWVPLDDRVYLHYAINVTERRRVEETLKRAHDEMEIRVEERTAELAKTIELLRNEITERRRVETALRESEDKYSTLVEESLTGVYIQQDGRIEFANERYAEIFGYSREEIIGMKSLGLVHPEDRSMVAEFRDQRLRGKGAPPEYESRGLTKDGRTIWVMRRNRRITYRGRPAVMGNLVDVTIRRRMEEDLRLLSSRLLSAEEKERKRIAQELHDSIGQSLGAIKFKVENTLNRLTDAASDWVLEALRDIIPLTQKAIEEVRRIVMDLRPSTLDDLGILPTISWFCREFERIYADIRIEREIDLQERDVPDTLKTVIYRVLQEALNNVAKHSGANLVRLSLKKRGGRVAMDIEDNGTGFDHERRLFREDPEGGFGLASMRERTQMSGGTFVLETGSGRGTAIRVSWSVD